MSCSAKSQTLQSWIAAQQVSVIDWQRHLTAIPALGPENGGTGELAKARYLEGVLESLGSVDIVRVDAQDARVPDGIRPNIVARIEGTSSRRLWLLGHMDVVPPGEAQAWKTDPWTLQVDGDRLIGRGVEDNQQAIVSMLLVAKALRATGVTPDLGLGMLFVSDEECGSRYGMEYVIRERPDLFGPDDLIVVPDMGVEDSSIIEVAEKGSVWVKVTVAGRQCHASTPEEGRNALVAAADMILHVKDVQARFAATDPLFDSPSTFVPTRHEENVPNINTLPGKDVFYVDCRILPCYTCQQVLDAFAEAFGEIARRHGVDVTVEAYRTQPPAPVTPVDSPVVRRLSAAVSRVLGVTPRHLGIGGMTVAAVFREQGFNAVGWATLGGTMHQPNEESRISRAIGDARVFAEMLFEA